KTEAESAAGLPGLKDIPLLKYFFSDQNKQKDETEIIIMLTPHIVRMPNIKDINVRGLNVGSVNIPRLRPDGLTTMVPAAPTTTPGPALVPPPPTPPGAATQPNPSPSAPLPPPTPTNTTIAFTPAPVTLVPLPPAGTTPTEGINTVNIT